MGKCRERRSNSNLKSYCCHGGGDTISPNSNVLEVLMEDLSHANPYQDRPSPKNQFDHSNVNQHREKVQISFREAAAKSSQGLKKPRRLEWSTRGICDNKVI